MSVTRVVSTRARQIMRRPRSKRPATRQIVEESM